MTRPAAAAEVVGDLLRVQALFQARTIAMHLGAPMPDPEGFRRVNGRVVEALRFIPAPHLPSPLETTR